MIGPGPGSALPGPFNLARSYTARLRVRTDPSVLPAHRSATSTEMPGLLDDKVQRQLPAAASSLDLRPQFSPHVGHDPYASESQHSLKRRPTLIADTGPASQPAIIQPYSDEHDRITLWWA
jgi:hypothetical protein